MKTALWRWTISDVCVLLATVLLFGYLIMSRTFAHWHLGPLFIGEITLAVFLFCKPDVLLLPWLNSLAVPSRLTGVGLWLMISVAYGALQTASALFRGPLMAAGEVFVFHLYPLFLLPGLWIARHHADFLSKLVLPLAWCHGLYGVVFITVLAPLGMTQSMDDPKEIGWFGHPAGAAILVLALLACERRWMRALIPILLNLLIMIGMQRRAEWIGFLAAVPLWAVLSGRLRQLITMSGLAIALLLVGLLPGIRFPSPGMRGESISTQDILGRIISPFSTDIARSLTPEADSQAATASWRSDFWASIWDEVHDNQTNALLGLGYHYPLWQLHPEEDLEENPVRTPHSIFMFVLAYSGWVGVLVFVGLQTALARLLWRTYVETGHAFGICLLLLTILWAAVDPMLERPFGAIPVYLLLGMSLAPGFPPLATRDTVVQPSSLAMFPSST